MLGVLKSKQSVLCRTTQSCPLKRLETADVPTVHRVGKQHLCVVPVFLIWKVNDNASLERSLMFFQGISLMRAWDNGLSTLIFLMELSLATAFQSILFLSLTLSSHTVN